MKPKKGHYAWDINQVVKIPIPLYKYFMNSLYQDILFLRRESPHLVTFFCIAYLITTMLWNIIVTTNFAIVNTIIITFINHKLYYKFKMNSSFFFFLNLNHNSSHKGSQPSKSFSYFNSFQFIFILICRDFLYKHKFFFFFRYMIEILI